MHEASVVANIVDAVLEELNNYDVKKVNSVTLTIGDLTQLGTEQLEFAYEVLSQGNILEGSRLIIEPEHIVLKCKECGFQGPARMISMSESGDHDIPVLSCSECGGAVDVVEGQACRVKCMDVDTGDE
ncbi:MAG: hydrogenase maturation nickel metallochaperone HypA [archaeon]|nr:hydrogenase maturation nickel metallochaperone HypA [archaeon]